MRQWVFSVAGIAVLSVLADVILPNGQTRKYVKTVIGVVVTMVLAQPVLNLSEMRWSGLEQSEILPQQQYLKYVSAKNSDEYSLQVALENAGFSHPKVSFSAKTQTYVAVMSEKHSEQLAQRAQNVAAACGLRQSVTFLWNNTE